MQHYTYDGIEFTVPEFCGQGVTLSVNPSAVTEDASHPILRNVHTIWDLDNFGIPRKPVIAGVVGDRSAFCTTGAPRTLDMPIKFPGTDYRLPLELVQLQGVLETIIGFEHAINPHADEYYAYVTVDQGMVRQGEMQRKGGLHVDGFQGARIQPKTYINRSYVVADMVPTVFYDQPFQTAHMDETRHNFFLDFDRQAQEGCVWRPEPFEIVLMDAYTVHRSDSAKQECFRTFLRVSYDVKIFDRLGNAHNPLFDYQWEMMARDTQAHLIAPARLQ